MEGQYYLKWNNHHNTLISVFDSLLGSGKHVDCTLAAEGHELGAHKVVLSACSPYLESLLNKPSEKHPIIIFNDVKYDELKAILEYMYRGEVNVLQEQLSGFLKAAEALQIKGLTDQGGGGGGNNRGGTDDADKEKEILANGGKRKVNRPNNSDIPMAENQQIDSSTMMNLNKRKRQRRPSQDKMSDGLADSGSSCDGIQAPSSNPPTVASTTLPAVTKIETDRLSNASVSSSGASQQPQPLPLVQTQVIIKEKIEPPEVLIQPKTEYIDDSNNENEQIEDLTLDDDEDDGGFMARPGPSHGDSQDYNSSWHLRDRPMEEPFLTAQDVMGNQNNSQVACRKGLKKHLQERAKLKNPPMEIKACISRYQELPTVNPMCQTLAKSGPCHKCGKHKNNKTTVRCSHCHKFVCRNHSKSIIECDSCNQK